MLTQEGEDRMRIVIIAASLLVASVSTASAATLDTVKQRGTLVCGVSTGFAGFSAPDSQGNFKGLDVDYCRALAAGVLGDPAKVRYVALTAQNRFTALQSGEIDVLLPQFDADLSARRHARPAPRPGQFLRRPGLCGEEGPRREGAEGSQGRHRLRRPGHHA